MRKLGNYTSVKASLIAFNGTEQGKRCRDYKELIAAWKIRRKTLGDYKSVALVNDNWRDFYGTAQKLFDNRARKI